MDGCVRVAWPGHAWTGLTGSCSWSLLLVPATGPCLSYPDSESQNPGTESQNLGIRAQISEISDLGLGISEIR